MTSIKFKSPLSRNQVSENRGVTLGFPMPSGTYKTNYTGEKWQGLEP
jgi:hypothetical protein